MNKSELREWADSHQNYCEGTVDVTPGNWDWYNQKAATQIEQAYGRIIRSKDDEGVMYILDESAKDLIRMNAGLFHTWFLEGIEDMKIDPSRGI
jgi:hypothetical protein